MVKWLTKQLITLTTKLINKLKPNNSLVLQIESSALVPVTRVPPDTEPLSDGPHY
jgi:hypothetical protein